MHKKKDLVIQWTLETAVYTILLLPLRTGVDKSPEEVKVEATEEVQNHLVEAFALTLTYRYTKDVWLDKVESYSGQDGKQEQRQL